MRRRAGTSARFALLAVVTAVLLVPVAVPVVQGVAPFATRGGLLLPALLEGPSLVWFRNSLAVSCSALVAALAIGAPAGYVLARGRGRLVDGFALVVFTLQSLPAVLLLVPLFVVFAKLGAVDSLPGVAVVYVGFTVALATWSMADAVAAVPVALEEAAWLDGCSVLSGFWRVVLPNAAGGVLTAGALVFLFAWNDWLVADLFLHTDTRFTVGIALAGSGAPGLTVLALLPPVALLAVLHRRLRIGGGAGALVG